MLLKAAVYADLSAYISRNVTKRNVTKRNVTKRSERSKTNEYSIPVSST